MIEIFYDPQKYKLLIRGHAGYARKGEDIVCAGASTLFCTLLQTLLTLEREGALEGEPTLDILPDGGARLTCTPLRRYRKTVDVAALTVMTGFRQLEKRYPQHVQIIKRQEK